MLALGFRVESWEFRVEDQGLRVEGLAVVCNHLFSLVQFSLVSLV